PKADIPSLPPPAFREDRQCHLMCRGIALAWSGPAKGRSYSFHLYDQSVTAITDVWAVSLQGRPQPGFRSPGRRWLCRAVAPQCTAEKDEARRAEPKDCRAGSEEHLAPPPVARRNLGEKTQNVHAAKHHEAERRDTDPHEYRVEHGVFLCHLTLRFPRDNERRWAATGPLESVRKHQAGLQSFRSMRRIEASRRNASALRLRFSQSFASLRQRLSQAKVRSTIQRRGSTTNPFVRSERLTISVSSCGKILAKAF